MGRNKIGNVAREEIKNKVKQLLGDENFTVTALKLKEITRNSVNEHYNKMVQSYGFR